MPANPTVIYVPVYDPRVVYGTWRYPRYQPYYWGPPPGLRVATTVDGIGFSIGFGIVDALWGWGDWDWARHDVRVNPERFNRINRGRPPVSSTVWQHAPDHRHGVPYAGAQTRSRFQPAVQGSPADRQGFRGFANTPSTQARPEDRSRAAAPAQQTRQAPETRNRDAAPASQAAPQGRQAPEQRNRDAAPQTRQAPAAPPQVAQPQAVQRQPEPARPQAAARPAAPEFNRQPPARPPTAFQSFGGGHARDDAQRGQASRQQAPVARVSAPAAQPRPAPEARPAPAPRPTPAAAPPARPAHDAHPAPPAQPGAPPADDKHHGREH